MRKLTALLLAALLLASLLAGCAGEAPATAAPSTTVSQQNPVIQKVLLIDDKNIEVYFIGTQELNAGVSCESLVIKNSQGEVLRLSVHYGGKGTVRINKMLTVQLEAPVSADAELTLTYLDTQETHAITYDSYYKYEIQADCGITIRGSRTIIWGEKTMQRAAEMVDTMAGQMPELVQKMVENNCSVSVYGQNEYAAYVPEYRGTLSDDNRVTAGLGGVCCSMQEANIWQWLYEDADLPVNGYFTRHVGENLLVHEFAHGIKSSGFDHVPALAEEWQMIYRHAKAAGLWPRSYAITNPDEFFAVLSTAWFNALNETNVSDYWDGTRGPINTRLELYNYDRTAYHFLAKLYPAVPDLGQDWDNIEDLVTVTDMPNDPLPEIYEEVTFRYPRPESGISFDKTGKLTLADSGYILRTTGKNNTLVLGYNTFKDYPATADNGLYTMEPVSREGNVCRVYLKNRKNGYLYVDGNQIGTSADGSRKTVFTVTVDAEGYATIGCEAGYWQISELIPGKPILLGSEPSKWQIAEAIELKKLLFVHDCTADGSADGLYAEAGQVITLTARVPEGKNFVGWKCSYGTLSDPTSETTTFTMPDSDTVVWALYE